MNEKGIESSSERVVCKVCGKSYKHINSGHLGTHSLTLKEYLGKFPGAKTITNSLRDQRSLSLKGKSYEELFKKGEFSKLKNQIDSEKVKYCKTCGKEITGQGKYFCSTECGVLHKTLTSRSNYKLKAFKFLENKCFYCDEIDKEKLLVHHLDGNRYNNDISNLRIVCAKHHHKLHEKEIYSSKTKKFKDKKIISAWRDIIDALGLDINDSNFKDTPFRVLKSYYEIFGGIDREKDINEVLSTGFNSEYDGMVVVSDIHCFSMCPHHFLPVEYFIDFGYIPNGKVLGISKLGRLVSLLAKQPILQEDLTRNIVKYITKNLNPLGVIVQVRGRHFCMVMRGVQQVDTWTLTSELSGEFDKASVREEFALMLPKRK